MNRLILPLCATLLLPTIACAAEISKKTDAAAPATVVINVPAENAADIATVPSLTTITSSGQQAATDHHTQKPQQIYQEPFMPLSLRTR